VLNKLLLTIGISLAISFCGGFSPMAVWAQCDCGQCADETVGYADDAGAIFLQNVGNGQSTTYPGCAGNLCERPSCPVVCCGPYVSAFGGWSNISDFFRLQDQGTQDSMVVIGTDPDTGEPIFETVTEEFEEGRYFNFDDNFAGGFAIGRQVHQRARMEVEAGARQYDFQSYQVQTFTDNQLTSDAISSAVGTLRGYTIMGNVLFDFAPRAFQRSYFYGGAGIGVLISDATATTATNIYTIDETSFAFQVIGGINRTITQRLDLFVEYRYVAADNINVFDQTAGASLGDFDYRTNDIFLGFRLRK